MVMHHLWLLSESGRLRQARALARTLPRDGALIVGGDFNAWFGFRDAAFRELAQQARRADTEDRARPSDRCGSITSCSACPPAGARRCAAATASTDWITIRSSPS